jgi:hypothetical protein
MTCFQSDFSQGKMCGRLECQCTDQATPSREMSAPTRFRPDFSSYRFRHPNCGHTVRQIAGSNGGKIRWILIAKDQRFVLITVIVIILNCGCPFQHGIHHLEYCRFHYHIIPRPVPCLFGTRDQVSPPLFLGRCRVVGIWSILYYCTIIYPFACIIVSIIYQHAKQSLAKIKIDNRCGAC